MKPYICTQCGATINRATMKCEYCGAQYEDRKEYFVLVDKPNVHVLKTKVAVDERLLQYEPELVAETCLNNMVREMAKSIAPFVDLQHEYDPKFNQHYFSGRLRVCDKEFRA